MTITKLLVTGLCCGAFTLQIRHPELVVHCGLLTLLADMLWIWG
jgi:hypothetical protein